MGCKFQNVIVGSKLGMHAISWMKFANTHIIKFEERQKPKNINLLKIKIAADNLQPFFFLLRNFLDDKIASIEKK